MCRVAGDEDDAGPLLLEPSKNGLRHIHTRWLAKARVAVGVIQIDPAGDIVCKICGGVPPPRNWMSVGLFAP